MSIKEQFYVPLEIRTRKGRGGNFSFVAWQDVINRLNEILGSNWSSELKSSEIVGPNIIVRVRVSFTNPETKEYCCQEGFGGAINDERLEAGSPFKAAYSKALKDACKRWGLGLYLEDEDQSSFSPPTTINPVVNKTNIPPATEPILTSPGTSSGVSIPTFPTQPAQTVVVPSPQPTILGDRAEIPKIPTTPDLTAPVSIPPTPFTKPSDGAIFSSSETVSVKPPGISDIQKVALGGIVSSKGIIFEELVKEAFTAHGIVKEPFPSRDDLTYDEAVLVIKYGNDKFRKQ
jgi:hypothetical protein